MVLLYFGIIGFLYCMYLLNLLFHSYIKKKLYEVKVYHSNVEINAMMKEFIEEFGIAFSILSIKVGKVSRYMPLKNELVIVKMNWYSILDSFICFHEIGHFLHMKLKNTFVYHIIAFLFGINRILIFPFLLVYSLILLFNEGTEKNYVYYAFMGIYILIAFLRLITIPFFEIKANKFAWNYLILKKQIIKTKSECSLLIKICMTAIINQIIMCLMPAFINCFIFFMITNK